MSNFLSRNAIKLVAFAIIFLSSANVFGGNDTIPSALQTAEEWSAKGDIAHNKWEYEEAIDCYEKAIKLNPNSVDIYFKLGYVYERGRQDYDKAIKCYNKAIEYLEKEEKLNPNLSYAYFYLGLAYAEGKQDYEKEIECFEKSIEYFEKEEELNPNLSYAYFYLGLAYQEQGNLEEAKEYLIKAARLGNKYSQRWLRDKNISC